MCQRTDRRRSPAALPVLQRGQHSASDIADIDAAEQETADPNRQLRSSGTDPAQHRLEAVLVVMLAVDRAEPVLVVMRQSLRLQLAATRRIAISTSI